MIPKTTSASAVSLTESPPRNLRAKHALSRRTDRMLAERSGSGNSDTAAARDRRPRPDGREHRTAPAPRRPSHRRAQPSAGAGRGARRGRRNRRELARGARLAARAAARGLAHAPGRRDHGERPWESPTGSSRATRSSTAETRTTPTTSGGRQELAARGIAYLDCGTSGGIFGLERGFCLMIGGDEGAFERLEPIFASLAPGVEAAPRSQVANRGARARGARLPPLRRERRGPLREDGPQRDRVRPHGRVRRGLQPPPPRRCRACRTATRTPRRRRSRTRSTTRTSSTWRDRRALEARERRLVLAPRPDLGSAARLARARGLRRPRLGLRRGSLDLDCRDRDRHADAGPHDRALLALHVERRGRLRATACSRRCAPSSEGTPRSPRDRSSSRSRSPTMQRQPRVASRA